MPKPAIWVELGNKLAARFGTGIHMYPMLPSDMKLWTACARPTRLGMGVKIQHKDSALPPPSLTLHANWTQLALAPLSGLMQRQKLASTGQHNCPHQPRCLLEWHKHALQHICNTLSLVQKICDGLYPIWLYPRLHIHTLPCFWCHQFSAVAVFPWAAIMLISQKTLRVCYLIRYHCS